MITKIGIESNMDKCQAIIAIKILNNVKEVHQLIGCMVALSRHLSCAGEKAFLFLVTFKEKERFQLTVEREGAFYRVKVFLTSSSIHARLREESLLLFYLFVTYQTMS